MLLLFFLLFVFRNANLPFKSDRIINLLIAVAVTEEEEEEEDGRMEIVSPFALDLEHYDTSVSGQRPTLKVLSFFGPPDPLTVMH